ncbi:uncharacterized protein I303_107527 [Kwoniella dejecticola CBS 10117]|uniref:BRCT domain-containing protein n=1 Tax=Kwoniella dejecticola CBS 10117 TaxID=1296121 RepID=A0A1A5ZZY8_9TREE|nr:uncharacterized protein I303_06932 [Kwoniella dejecticola CBS 10117]OBR83367.1 hypothetical protein I303_06932 [Kwoniella dejecticola CBS 10117]
MSLPRDPRKQTVKSDQNTNPSPSKALLFRGEKSHVHGPTTQRCREIEDYLVREAGGLIVDQATCTFIVTTLQTPYLRSYAESLPKLNGEKVISLDWITESVNRGMFLSRATFWAIPRTEVCRRQEECPEQTSGMINLVKEASSSQPNLLPGLESSVTGTSGSRWKSLPGSTSSRNHYRVSQSESSKQQSETKLTNANQSLRLGQEDAQVRCPSGITMAGNWNNAMVDDPSRYAIFTKHDFWVVGGPARRKLLEELIQRASRVVFFPPNHGFLDQTRIDHKRAVIHNCPCVTYKWVEASFAAGRLLDETEYQIRAEDLFDNAFWGESQSYGLRTRTKRRTSLSDLLEAAKKSTEPPNDSSNANSVYITAPGPPNDVDRYPTPASPTRNFQSDVLHHPTTATAASSEEKKFENTQQPGSSGGRQFAEENWQPGNHEVNVHAANESSDFEGDPVMVSEMEEDSFADLAGLFSSDNEDEDTAAEVIDNKGDQGNTGTTLTSGTIQPANTQSENAGGPANSVSSDKHKRSSIGRGSTASGLEIGRNSETDEEDDGDTPLRIKRKRPFTSPSKSLVEAPKPTTVSTGKRLKSGKVGGHGSGVEGLRSEVLPRDREKYNALLEILSEKVKNNDLPDGLKKFLATRDGAPWLYKKYRNLFRKALPDLPLSAFQQRSRNNKVNL